MAAYHLATAVVEIGTGLSSLQTGLSTAKSMVTSAIGGIASLFNRYTALAGGVAAGFVVKAASDAQELTGMFDAVFKEQSDNAGQFAQKLAIDIGRGVNEIKGTMAGFQDTFVPLGFARDEATELSKRMTMLTSDLASFKNMSDEAASERLIGTLVGNHENARAFGVVITENTLKAELARMGADNLTGSMLEQAKVTARMNILLAGTTDAQGDALRTADGFANRMRGLKGAITDVAADIGSALLPALSNIAKVATDALRAIQPRIQAFAKNFASWGNVITKNWGTTWEIVKNTVVLGVETAKAIFFQLPEAWAFSWGKAIRMTVDAVRVITDVVRNAWSASFQWVEQQWDQLFENIIAKFQGREAAQIATPFTDTIGSMLGNKMAKMGKAFNDGLNSGLTDTFFTDTFEMSPGMQKALNKNKELIGQLNDARAKLDGKSVTINTEGGVMKAGKIAVEKMELGAGFTAFEDMNKSIQDGLLKQADPQLKMVGELEFANANGKRQVAILDQIAKNTKGQGNRPAAI